MKAVIGSWEDRPYRLLAELAALRSRVAELQDDRTELEAELESVREENDALRELVRRDELEVVLSGR
jgi:prefoldin subunit 5